VLINDPVKKHGNWSSLRFPMFTDSTDNMIIGHLAIAGIVKQTWFKRENLLFLCFAAFGPDLVDKPLNMVFGLSGRGAGHSLLFYLSMILISCFLGKWLKFSSQTLYAGIVMWGTHIVCDFLEPQVLFWPLLGQWEPGPNLHLFQKLWRFYIQRSYFAQFWMEISCISALIALLLFKQFTSASSQREDIQLSEFTSPDNNLYAFDRRETNIRQKTIF
jgi:hypothetical protein